ncbi:MAG: sigma 54-interacting transcriptional regulator [Vicinamibacteria bacterium]
MATRALDVAGGLEQELRAAEELSGRGRHREALLAANRLLVQLGRAPELEPRLRLVRGAALVAIGSTTAGLDHLGRARGAFGAEAGRAALWLARVHLGRLALEEARAELDAAARLLRGEPDEARAEVLELEAAWLRDRGRATEALACEERRAQLLSDAPAALRGGAACSRACLLVSLGRWDESRLLLGEAAELLAGDAGRAAVVLETARAALAVATGDCAGAREASDRAAALARTLDDARLPAELLLLRSDAELAAGDAAAADAVAAEAQARFSGLGEARGEAWARIRRAHALVAQGETERAAREARAARRLAPSASVLRAWAALALGRALLRSDPERAAEAFEETLQVAGAGGRSDLVHAATLGVALAQGGRGEARRRAALEALAVWGDRRVLGLAIADARALLGEHAAQAPPERGAAAGPDPDTELPGLLGRCEAIRALKREVARVAESDAFVHLMGETGTGKGRLAEAIHLRSRRAAGPFVAVNASALPDELFEAELFGHARGAFTGAVSAREGLVAAAEGGTLFLDEVADLSPRAQAKLLLFLQDLRYRKLGESGQRRADLRVITAANVPLDERVASGRFRADLFYRLAVVRLRLPPLRERGADVGLLARHFLERFAARDGRPAPALGRELLALLEAHAWPGNVRELENAMQRALVLAGPVPLQRGHFDETLGRTRLAPAARSLREALRGFERGFVGDALRRCGGNRTRAAVELGLTRQALLTKVQRLGLA